MKITLIKTILNLTSTIKASVIIGALLLSSAANATIIYNIDVRGTIVGDPYTTGSFLDGEGSGFAFLSTFHLEVGSAVNSRVNWEGYQVWELNDPTLNTQSIGCIGDGREPICVKSSSIEIEFQDSRTEKWASNPDFGFLGLTEDDVSYDIIGLGMPMSYTTDSLEYYMFLAFEGGLFDGYAINSLPKTIDMSKLKFAAAEFYQDTTQSREEGFARLNIDSIELTQKIAVPEPSTSAAFVLGVLFLAFPWFKRKY